MPNTANRVYCLVASAPGTGTITLGSARPGYVTFATAFGTTTTNIRYVIEDGNDWEIGVGTYTTGANTLTRSVTQSSNSNALINASANALVFATLSSQDFAQIDQAQTLTNKTLLGAILNDGYTEEVFAITDGASVVLNPNNGSIQTWTLGANRTPTAAAGWNSGQSMILMIDDGTAFSITWTSVGVIWETNGGTAPTLSTSGLTPIVLWKVGSSIYGARVGDA